MKATLRIKLPDGAHLEGSITSALTLDRLQEVRDNGFSTGGNSIIAHIKDLRSEYQDPKRQHLQKELQDTKEYADIKGDTATEEDKGTGENTETQEDTDNGEDTDSEEVTRHLALGTGNTLGKRKRRPNSSDPVSASKEGQKSSLRFPAINNYTTQTSCEVPVGPGDAQLDHRKAYGTRSRIKSESRSSVAINKKSCYLQMAERQSRERDRKRLHSRFGWTGMG